MASKIRKVPRAVMFDVFIGLLKDVATNDWAARLYTSSTFLYFLKSLSISQFSPSSNI